MKYLKHFENEFTRLAANMYISKLHNDYKFTSPVDDKNVVFCKITFPDDAEIIFKCTENLNSDTSTLKLIKSTETQNQNSYIDLYGDIIQFDDYTAYKMIRLYTNFEDLLDTHFDGYIINEKALGFTEIGIDIVKSESTGLSQKNFGIFKGGRWSGKSNIPQNLAIKYANEFIKEKENWRSYFRENKMELLFDFLDILDDFETKGEKKVLNLFEIETKGINLMGYLYLYYINISFDKKIEEVLRNPFDVKRDLLIGLLRSI